MLITKEKSWDSWVHSTKHAPKHRTQTPRAEVGGRIGRWQGGREAEPALGLWASLPGSPRAACVRVFPTLPSHKVVALALTVPYPQISPEPQDLFSWGGWLRHQGHGSVFCGGHFIVCLRNSQSLQNQGVPDLLEEENCVCNYPEMSSDPRHAPNQQERSGPGLATRSLQSGLVLWL